MQINDGLMTIFLSSKGNRKMDLFFFMRSAVESKCPSLGHKSGNSTLI